ncbi:hypothetical protein F2Q69_00053847 [Brassica cretica]|uniref:Uncharacterized protein n=1 Tax=Brassica cretica TaxID=69181 RepID=A0A8S9MX65_BRACR|nr:hypothetical protein F2Q69_00053847 [Brassica cretica]
MRRQNRVNQVVTTGFNPQDKGYDTTVNNTCSRSRKSLPQLAEACVSRWSSRTIIEAQKKKEKFADLTGLELHA